MARNRRLASAALVSSALLCLGILPKVAEAGARLEDDVEVFADDAGAPRAAAAQSAPASGAAEEERRRPANNGDWFRAPVYDAAAANGPVDFPAEQVRDAVVANARAAESRALFRRAESDLSAAVRQAERSFETSQEYRDAVAAEQKAYEAYAAARREALRNVVADSKYQAMQGLRQNIAEQIADRREAVADAMRSPRVRLAAAPHPHLDADAASAAALVEDDSLVAMAALKMRVGSDARAMERDALEADPQLRDARRNLAAASGKVAELRAKFDETARNDPNIATARDTLADARVARVTAEAYFRGADLAAGEALDFAYRLHRYDKYRYLYGDRYYGHYPYYSYGYGVGYGYPVRYRGRAHRPPVSVP